MAVLKKTDGSTLIETLLSLTIIMVCFSIGMMIFNNILKNSNNRLQTEAFFKIKELAIDAINNDQMNNETIEFEEFFIVKTTRPFENIKNLYIIEIAAYKSEDKKLTEFKLLHFIE